jgi:kynurenine formamidase
MPETVLRNGKRVTLYDLSDCLTNATTAFEFNKHEIEYISARQMAEGSAAVGLGPEYWPGGEGLMAETVTLSTHSGTHVDAPAHYGPAADGSEALTIPDLPLSWCYGNGVRLDMSTRDRVEGVRAADIEQELDRIGYEIQPDDIVLVMTKTDLRRPGYENHHAGLWREAVEYLLDRGVHTIGIDSWTVDRAVDVMIEEARAGKIQVWEAHLVGRERPYSQIERLANLEQLPRDFGFTLCAFPFKIEGASAAWTRVVAIVDEEDA